nr:hypothetical protein [Paenibacillus xylanexedens]
MKYVKLLSSIAVASMLLASPTTIFAAEGSNSSSIVTASAQEANSEVPVYSMAVHEKMTKEVELGLITTDEQAWERMAELDKILSSSNVISPMSVYYGGYLSSVAEMTAAIGKVGPIDAYTARGNASEAVRAAEASGYNGANDGKQDAFRHAYWNILMTRDIGASQAKEVADTHEEFNPGTAMQGQMDDYNNSVGRSLFPGGSPSNSSLITIIKNGMTSGKFLYIAGGQLHFTNYNL